jgi:predicted PurR-regulated permease PerM
MIIGLWALTQLWPILILIAVALLFMVALLPYVEWMVEKGLPRTVAVLILILGIIGVVAGLMALMVPAMVDEFTKLDEDLPEDARDAENFLDDFGIEVDLQQRARDFDWGDVISGEAAFDYGQRAVLVIFTIITVVVLTAYLLVDLPRLSRFFYQFIPPGREPEFEHLAESLSRVVGGYIRGQAVTSAAIGFYTLVVLLIVDVPNPVAFAVLAAFVDIIPLVGATIAVVLPTLSAFQESPTQAVIVLIALMAYQQFEDRFLVPRVYGATLNLPPIVVLIAVLVGGRLLGIAGVLLALPAAAIARVALDYVIERRGVLPPLPTDEPVAPD